MVIRCLLTIWITAGAAMAQTADPAAVLLENAARKERVAGDLKGAIAEYQKIAAKFAGRPEVAAQALVKMGQCQEKLGETEARRSYERVVKEYAGVGSYAAQARARLAAMGTVGGDGVRARLLWDDAENLSGRVSADGRYLTYFDWKACDFALRDLVAGTSRPLTNRKFCGGTSSVLSPDGKRVAYGERLSSSESELWVAGADMAGAKELMKGMGLDYIVPEAWSPDGKWIAASAVFRGKPGGDDKLVLVSPDSGQVRTFETAGAWPENVSFSPDGRWLAYSTGGDNGSVEKVLIRSAEGENSAAAVVAENAKMMGWAGPARVLFSRDQDGKRELFVLPVKGAAAAGTPRAMNLSADVGKQPAGMTASGALVYKIPNYRSEARVVEAEKGTVVQTWPATPSVGWKLGPGATHFSGDGKRLLMVTPANAISIRELPSGEGRVVTPQVKSFKAMRWAHDDRSLLVLGESRDGRTGVMRVNDVSGAAEMLLEVPQDTWGFTISRDGKTIFFGTPKKTQARNLATGESRVLWEYPEIGNYDLRVSRNGKRLAIRGGRYLTVVDLTTWQTKEIYRSPANSGQLVWALDWSADDRKLVTTVRVTADASGKMETWIFSPDGGAPEKRDWLDNRTSLSISPDGKWVAQTQGTGRAQVWTLENFLPAK